MSIFCAARLVIALKASYQVGGINGLYEAHLLNVQKSAFYRVGFRLFDLVIPLSVSLDLATSFDGQLKEMELYEACRTALQRFLIPWQAHFPQGGERIISNAPVVIYGNHSSAIAPVLVAASLDRSDLKIITASYVERLGPNVARHVLPIRRTYSFNLRRRIGLRHVTAGLILDFFHPRQDKSVARTHNQVILNAATHHLLRGGAVLIFPQGAHRDGQSWFPGIGIIVSNLIQQSSPGTIYLVPVRIENDSNARVHSLISRHPIFKLKARLGSRQPIQVIFDRPIPIERLIGAQSVTPQSVTEHLENHYKTLFRGSGKGLRRYIRK